MVKDCDNCCLLLGTLQLGISLLDEDAPIVLHTLHKVANELELHLKAVGDFLLGSATLRGGFDNLKPLLSTQLVQLASLEARMDRVNLLEEVLLNDFDEKTATSDAGINKIVIDMEHLVLILFASGSNIRAESLSDLTRDLGILQ